MRYLTIPSNLEAKLYALRAALDSSAVSAAADLSSSWRAFGPHAEVPGEHGCLEYAFRPTAKPSRVLLFEIWPVEKTSTPISPLEAAPH